MKRSVITSCVLLALAVAVCVWGDVTIGRTVTASDQARLRAASYAETGDMRRAAEEVARLAADWERAAPILEMLASHGEIHRVQEELARGRVLLRCGDADGFQESMALLGECLDHLRSMENITLANIF